MTVRVSSCGVWDIVELQSLLKHTWETTYAGLLGQERAREHGGRFSKLYLLWLLGTSWRRQGKLLKATAAERMVGMAYAVKDQDGVVLYMLYVHPNHHARGAGSKLLAAIEQWGSKERAIRVEVLAGNTPAIEWYKAKGFDAYGHTPHATGTPGIPSIYLDKKLG